MSAAHPLFHVGAICIYWGIDEEGHRMALLHHRKEKTGTRHKYGIVGGYANPDEPSIGTARRETMEELRTPFGMTVFTPDREKYEFLGAGANTQKSPPVYASVYAYQLSQDEMEKIKDHIEHCQSPPCRAAATRASEGETMAIEWLPLDHITQLSPKEFTHSSHHEAFCYFAAELDERDKLAQAKMAHRRTSGGNFTWGRA